MTGPGRPVPAAKPAPFDVDSFLSAPSDTGGAFDVDAFVGSTPSPATADLSRLMFGPVTGVAPLPTRPLNPSQPGSEFSRRVGVALGRSPARAGDILQRSPSIPVQMAGGALEAGEQGARRLAAEVGPMSEAELGNAEQSGINLARRFLPGPLGDLLPPIDVAGPVGKDAAARAAVMNRVLGATTGRANGEPGVSPSDVADFAAGSAPAVLAYEAALPAAGAAVSELPLAGRLATPAARVGRALLAGAGSGAILTPDNPAAGALAGARFASLETPAALLDHWMTGKPLPAATPEPGAPSTGAEAPPPPAPGAPAATAERPYVPFAERAAAQGVDISGLTPEEVRAFDAPDVQAAQLAAEHAASTHTIDTPERQGIRDNVVETLYENNGFRSPEEAAAVMGGVDPNATRPAGQPPTAHIVLGPPGSGKSTYIVSKILSEHPWTTLVDADEAKALLPEANQPGGAMVNHEESAHLAERLLEKAVDANGDVVVSRLGSNGSGIRALTDRLKRVGYDVKLYAMEASPETAARGAHFRFTQTGRYLDPVYAMKSARQSMASVEALKTDPEFSSVEIWRNPGFTSGSPPYIISGGKEGLSGTGEAAPLGGAPEPAPARPGVGRAGADAGAHRGGGAGAGEAASQGGAAGAPAGGTPAARVAPTLGRPRLNGVDGLQDILTLPDGSKLGVTYRVVEAGDLRPSHNPVSFAPNPDYPEGVQGRRYHTDRAAQENVVAGITKLDPDLLLRDTGSAAGAPVVTPDGVVVAGNQRSMMLQGAAASAPERFAAYRQALVDRASRFGIDPTVVEQMREPVLVRELEPQSIDVQSPEALRRLNDLTDQSTTKARSATDEGMARANRLANATGALQHFTETIGPDQSVRQYLDTPAGRQFVEALVREGVIPRAEAGAFFDRQGNATPAAKDLLERTFAAAAVGDPDVLDAAPKAARAKLEGALPAIVKTTTLGDYSLRDELAAGLRELGRVEQLKRSGEGGIKSLADLRGQSDIFGGGPTRGQLLADLLEGNRVPKAAVSDAFRKYAALAAEAQRATGGSDMFGYTPPTPDELFHEVFGKFSPDASARVADNAARAYGRAVADRVAGKLRKGADPAQQELALTTERAASTLGLRYLKTSDKPYTGIFRRVPGLLTEPPYSRELLRDLKLRQRTEPIVGKRIRSPRDIAVASQVFRDPRWETFRIGYVKDGHVVAVEEISSRPARRMVSAAFATLSDPNGNMGDTPYTARHIRDRAQKLGADSYWFQHNHPSGTPTPSNPDLAMTRQVTSAVAARLDWNDEKPLTFLGHIIVDHESYGHISRNGATAVRPLPKSARVSLGPRDAGFDPNSSLVRPATEADTKKWFMPVGTPIIDPVEVASRIAADAKTSQHPGRVFLLYHADAASRVVGVEEVPMDLVERALLQDKVKESITFLREHALAMGSHMQFAYADSHAKATLLGQWHSELGYAVYGTRSGPLTDIVYPGPDGGGISAAETHRAGSAYFDTADPNFMMNAAEDARYGGVQRQRAVAVREPTLDIFGNPILGPGERMQESLLDDKAGTESARSLDQTERAYRGEVARLRQELELTRDPARRQQLAEQIADREKLVNRGQAISPEEMGTRAAAAPDAEAPPASQPSLFGDERGAGRLPAAGMVAGAGAGAAVGAARDKQHPGRGAALGALAGAATGSMLGTAAERAAGVDDAAGTFAKFGDSFRRTFAPASRSPEAALTADIVRHRAGELAHDYEQANTALRGFRQSLDRLPAGELLTFNDRIERGAAQPTPAQTAASTALRTALDGARRDVQALGTGKLEHFIDNYLPHIWADPAAAAEVMGRIGGKRPFEGTKSFLKQRTIPTILEGMFPDGAPADLATMSRADIEAEVKRQKGLLPVSWNPVDLTMLKLREMRRYVMAQRILQDLRAQKLLKFVRASEKAPDGYELIDDRVSTVYGPRGMAPAGPVIVGRQYAPEPVARVLNNYLSPGLGGNGLYDAYRSLGNLLNQAQLGFSAFHLGFTSLDAAVSKNALALEQLAQGHPLKALASAARSPLAPVENILRGDKVLREYMTPGSAPEMAGIVEQLIRAGGRAKMDSFYESGAAKKFLEAWRERRPAGVLGYGLPAFIDMAAKPVLEWAVPRQKLGVFADLAQQEIARLGPEASDADVRHAMGKAWDSVDNRMGQLVYDNLFWNRAAKDLGMASVRSVGWNLGTIRELGGGLADLGRSAADVARGKGTVLSHRAAYVLALPATVGLVGGLMHYLATGQAPSELKDWFYPKTGRQNPDGTDERVQLPSYLKDVYAYGTQPWQTVKHKVNPLLQGVTQMLENRDFYGNMIRNPDDPLVRQLTQEATYWGREFEPFGVQYAFDARSRGQSKLTTAGNFIGVTPAPRDVVRTPAQNRMAELLARRGQMTLTPEQVDERDTRRSLERQLTSDRETGLQAVSKAETEGTLTHKQAAAMRERSYRDPEALRFQQLTLDEAVDVYHRGTPEERASWWPALLRKAHVAAGNDPTAYRAYLAAGLNQLPRAQPKERTTPGAK